MGFFTHPSFNWEQKKETGQLWVTTVGCTALVVVLETFGADWDQWFWLGGADHELSGIEWAFTWDRLTRYAFAFWFGIYIVLQFLANEARPDGSRWGLAFDVVQSVLVFTALGFLGFITQNFAVYEDMPECPPTVAFGAILAIGIWTLVWHRLKGTVASSSTPAKAVESSLQSVRRSVAIVALIGIIYVQFVQGRLSLPAWGRFLTFLLVVLCLAGLYRYANLRFRATEDEQKPPEKRANASEKIARVKEERPEEQTAAVVQPPTPAPAPQAGKPAGGAS